MKSAKIIPLFRNKFDISAFDAFETINARKKELFSTGEVLFLTITVFMIVKKIRFNKLIKQFKHLWF
jgi:hypothetical protein